MTESGKKASVGKMVLEQRWLEAQIGSLRAAASRRARVFVHAGNLLASRPEKLSFSGMSLDSRFEGERTIDKKDLDADTVIALINELRAAMLRKEEILSQLAVTGLDPKRP